ncbi:VOC family protein [Phenylobacterium sp. LjRoot219]|uniref:VOC family protein n=1 Tax=Phenylobacterium sp. LjRoot219 TaxID=3342283 RepID=UPI003ECDB9A1
MIRGIHHVAINTPNLDRLVAFYRDVVGFEVVESTGFEWSDSPEIDTIVGIKGSASKVVMLKAANSYIEMFEYQRPAARYADRLNPSDHGYTHICLDVTDVDAEYARLSQNGMTFHAPPTSVEGGRIKTVYGRDPDGNIIELQQLAADHDMSVQQLRGYGS